MREAVISRIKEKKVIAIVRGIYGAECRRLAQALLDGGICVMEFTFDQKHPEDWEKTCANIRMIAEEFAGSMVCGAGTVLSCEQVRLAKQAGARLIVSPNVKEQVIKETVKEGMVSIPGAMSPSEVQDAYEFGADFVKIFPAGNLGPGYIKALRGPLNHIPLLAVGGIHDANAAEYLAAGADGVGIGGDLVKKAWVQAGEFDRITELAARIVRNTTGE